MQAHRAAYLNDTIIQEAAAFLTPPQVDALVIAQGDTRDRAHRAAVQQVIRETASTEK